MKRYIGPTFAILISIVANGPTSVMACQGFQANQTLPPIIPALKFYQHLTRYFVKTQHDSAMTKLLDALKNEESNVCIPIKGEKANVCAPIRGKDGVSYSIDWFDHPQTAYQLNRSKRFREALHKRYWDAMSKRSRDDLYKRVGRWRRAHCITGHLPQIAIQIGKANKGKLHKGLRDIAGRIWEFHGSPGIELDCPTSIKREPTDSEKAWLRKWVRNGYLSLKLPHEEKFEFFRSLFIRSQLLDGPKNLDRSLSDRQQMTLYQRTIWDLYQSYSPDRNLRKAIRRVQNEKIAAIQLSSNHLLSIALFSLLDDDDKAIRSAKATVTAVETYRALGYTPSMLDPRSDNAIRDAANAGERAVGDSFKKSLMRLLLMTEFAE